MAKIKILGIGKSAKHSHYVFPKEQKVLAVVRALLKELGFDEYKANEFGRPVDKKYGEIVMNDEINVKEYTDKRFALDKEDMLVEVVFGKGKVFVSIHSEKDMQQKISNVVKKFVKK